MKKRTTYAVVGLGVAASAVVCAVLVGAHAMSAAPKASIPEESQSDKVVVQEESAESSSETAVSEDGEASEDAAQEESSQEGPKEVDPADFGLNLTQDFRSDFVHGDKPYQYQKYIVLHDTEGGGEPESVISFWEGNGNLVAAHFVIGKDGRVVQCVPLDKIAHHAGFGDTGHNDYFGVADESRDDKAGTKSIGSWASDYGMNSYSIGIEMIHIGGEGAYPEAQLQALDNLIAYIDAATGTKSTIIDHKMWRSGNSDTSPEFATYLSNYQTKRTHA